MVSTQCASQQAGEAKPSCEQSDWEWQPPSAAPEVPLANPLEALVLEWLDEPPLLLAPLDDFVEARAAGARPRPGPCPRRRSRNGARSRARRAGLGAGARRGAGAASSCRTRPRRTQQRCSLARRDRHPRRHSTPAPRSGSGRSPQGGGPPTGLGRRARGGASPRQHRSRPEPDRSDDPDDADHFAGLGRALRLQELAQSDVAGLALALQ